jgi:hypothetical protein
MWQRRSTPQAAPGECLADRRALGRGFRILKLSSQALVVAFIAVCRTRAATLACLVLCAFPWAAPAQTHRLVQVGDHRLDAVTTGSGGPALVFETGLADSLDTWLPMLRTMGNSTIAVAYSRAGLGRSELGSSHNTVPEEAADLHALLRPRRAASVHPRRAVVWKHHRAALHLALPGRGCGHRARRRHA